MDHSRSRTETAESLGRLGRQAGRLRLASLRLKGHRRVRDLDLSLPAAGPLVITGSSGSGKTTVLQAIAAARAARSPNGLQPFASDWPGRREEEAPATIDATWTRERADAREQMSTSWRVADRRPSETDEDWFPRYSTAKDTPKLEYFHANRRLDTTSAETELLTDKEEGGRRLTTDSRKYAWVRSFLALTQADRAVALGTSLRSHGLVVAGDAAHEDGFAANVAQLSDTLRYVGLRRVSRATKVFFARPSGAELELDALTDSERMIVLFAASFEALGLYRSVILIDTPELAIHPAEHADLFRRLCLLAPEAQVIAATTSSAILREMPSEAVLVL